MALTNNAGTMGCWRGTFPAPGTGTVTTWELGLPTPWQVLLRQGEVAKEEAGDGAHTETLTSHLKTWLKTVAKSKFQGGSDSKFEIRSSGLK